MNRRDDWGVAMLMGMLTLAFGWSFFQPLPRWAYAIGAILFGGSFIGFIWTLFLDPKRPRVEAHR